MGARKGAKCIIKGCVDNANIRGLCTKCYSSAHFLVKNGKATWEQLIAMGLAGSRKKQSVYGAFAKAFDEAIKDQNDKPANRMEPPSDPNAERNSDDSRDADNQSGPDNRP